MALVALVLEPVMSVAAAAAPNVVAPSSRVVHVDGASLDSLVVSSGGVAFASNPAANRIEVVDLATGTLGTPIAVGVQPRGMDLSPDESTLYVTDAGSMQISVVDVATRVETRRIAVPPALGGTGDASTGNPRAIAVASNGEALVSTTFVPVHTGGFMLEVDLATGVFRRRDDFGPWAMTTEMTNMRPSGDHSRIGVVVGDSSDGEVRVYNAATDSFGPDHRLGWYYDNIALDRTGSRVLVDPNGYLFEGDTLIGRIPGGDGGRGVVIAPSGTTGYRVQDVGYDGTAIIQVLDLVRLQITATIALPEPRGTAPGLVGVSGDGSTLAVLTATGVSLVPVAAAQPVAACANTLTQTTPTTRVLGICGAPLASVVTDRAGHAFVSNPSRNQIDVVNVATGALESTIDVGSEPAGLDFSPDDTTLYVADSGGSQVSVIDVATRHETGRINLPPEPDPDVHKDTPFAIAVANNGKALVSMRTAETTGGRLFEIDLATGVGRWRRDFNNGGYSSSFTPLASSGDHSRIGIAIGNVSNGPTFMYTAATDSFSPEHDFGFLNTIALDHTGDRVLVGPGNPGTVVVDANLNPLGNFADHGQAITFGPSGTAYRLQPASVDILDVAGRLVERSVHLSENAAGFPGSLAVSTDEATLAVVTDSGLSLVTTAATVDGYTPLVPVRVCDTRIPNKVMFCDPHGSLGPTGQIWVRVLGQLGVPSTASAVVLNVTATNTTASSYLTVFAGDNRPTAASLVWKAGQTVSNLVQVPTNGFDSINIFNGNGNADVVVDLQGYVDWSSNNLLTPLTPTRICDSRTTGPGVPINQCQKPGGAAGTLAPWATKTVTVTGHAGVPAGSTAAVLNVTITNPKTAGFLTVWPHGTTNPAAANLVWAAGQTVSSRVIVGLGAGGAIDLFLGSTGTADVVIDANGYFSPSTTAGGFIGNTPARVCDTRPAGPGIAANPCNNPAQGGGTLTSNDELVLFVPAAATAQVFNVTVADTTASSFLTVFPDPTPDRFTTPPLAADLVWTAGQLVANLVIVAPAGTPTAIAFYNLAGKADLVIDLEGVYKPASAITTISTNTAKPTVTIQRHRPDA